MYGMSFFRAVNPKAAWADIVEIWRGEQRYKIHFLLLAFFTTALIFVTFLFESGFEKEPKPLKLIYINSWSADRTDEEIMAENIEVQKETDRRNALIEQRKQEEQDSYRRLGERFGMEIDEDAPADGAGDEAQSASPQPAPAAADTQPEN